MKFKTYAALLTSILATGCASSGSKRDAESAAGAASAEVPASSALITIPQSSAKRLVLSMTGPNFVIQAKDWPAFQEEWRATFADHAKQAGVEFEVQGRDALLVGAAGTLLQVYVNDYRMVGIGSRIFFGVMTGNAYIDAKATFSDLRSDTSFGERIYNTSSTAWAGVFAKMTPQQVDSIASQVFADFSPGTAK